MTTVPLSVCYGGAKPLGHARGVRGPKSTVPSSAILVGSVAAERSYRALGTLVPKFSILGGGGGGECSLLDLGPMLVPMFFLFIIVPIPFLVGPFVLSRIPCFVPKRRSQRGVVVFEEPKRLWLYCPKPGLL